MLTSLTPCHLKINYATYLTEMHDVIGVNVFPLQVNEIPPHEKGLRHPSPTTATIQQNKRATEILFFPSEQ